MNEYYTFKWQLEITEFSPILMPSSTIEFITTEDFGMGVQFWNNKIATANKNLERKLVSSAKLQNAEKFSQDFAKEIFQSFFRWSTTGSFSDDDGDGNEDVKKEIGLLETFRFEDEDDHEYEIWLKVFCVFSKYRLPGILHFTIFH